MSNNRALDDVLKNLAEDLTNLSDECLQVLNDLKDGQVVSHTLLQYEARRIEKRFGKDDPRMQQIRARLKQNIEVIHDLEVEVEIGRIKIPEVSQDETLIHGRVVDKEYRGISGLLVLMTDQKREKLIKLGRSETDTSGYYSLVFSSEIFEKFLEVIKGGIFLTVFTSKGSLVHRELEPVKVAKGDRVLVEVVLNRDDLSSIKLKNRD